MTSSSALIGGGYLQAAEADHAVHHLGDAETVAEVVEWVVLVVVMDTKLRRVNVSESMEDRVLRVNVRFASHQPSLQRDGVDVEVFDQSQVVVHVFQAAQHLQEHQTDESFLLFQ